MSAEMRAEYRTAGYGLMQSQLKEILEARDQLDELTKVVFRKKNRTAEKAQIEFEN